MLLCYVLPVSLKMLHFIIITIQLDRMAGADLGFIKGGGGLTQGTNLLGRGVQSTQLGGSAPGKF